MQTKQPARPYIEVLSKLKHKSGLQELQLAYIEMDAFWTSVVVGAIIATVILACFVCCHWTPRQPQERSQDERQAPLPASALNLEDFIKQNLFSLQSRRESFESTDGSDPVFDGFIIEQVIPKTENQRKNWQFACLMLRGASETQFIYRPQYSGNIPYVNDSKAFSPPVTQLHNYIIARPSSQAHGQKHAEEVILDNFNTLWKAYKRENRNQKPASVVLFSWIIPCVTCTSKLIETLSNLGVPACIAYTIKYHRESEQQMQNSVRKIEESGMIIEQVHYPDRLKSKHF